MVLINLSFWNGTIKLRLKLIKEQVIRQIIYIHISIDIASSPDIKNNLHNIHKDFVVVPDKTIGNIAFVCRRFYASVTTRELGFNNNSSTNNAGGLYVNYIIDKNRRHLKIKFGFDNISIENH